MGSDKVLTHPAPMMSVKLEGPLTKWTNVVQGWQYRWFVLDENSCLLSYYTSKDKMMKGARRGCLRLKGGKIGINDEDDSTFTITCDHRTFHFQARDGDERTRWVQSLEETILLHSSGGGTSSSTSLAMEEELNRRMQEAEGYFRLVTEQAKNLELKLNQPNKVKTERCTMLKDSVTQMIETMGQTIELLHTTKQSLAKKVPVPVINNKPLKPYQDGASAGSTPSVITLDSDRSPDSDTKVEVTNGMDNVSTHQEVDITITQAGSTDSIDSSAATAEEGKSEEQVCAASSTVNEPTKVDEEILSSIPMHLMSMANSIVPTSSYTSSDEEDMDEFFDAHDEFSEQITLDEISDNIKAECDRNSARGPVSADDGMIYVDDVKVNGAEQHTALQVQLNVPPRDGDSGDEWDVEDDDVEGGNTDMQAHGSVITHLLSQVRIGMDLTKVTLPTFILERRSLLEMYADFFAHPDLFKGISDKQGPEERMVAVLKWYLSSFHAGRKGDVAKKPYNPILGEILQCFYDLTDSEKSYGADNYGTEPIPWCNKSDVAFLAEQVSHHPPISAFYAECAEKKVCFNAHVWTKSKFLGLSIGVHNVGTGNLFLCDHDEEYVLTFPNGYGRSILTVPWIELGGKTEITCKASGYTTQLEFHSKPFYGGKKHRVTADVYRPDGKKPFLNIYGEWNGVIYAKYEGRKEPEVFFDTLTVPTSSKKVRALHKQESFESRNLWRDVTRSLKENNIEGATAGKHKNEEVQRQDARMRKETNTKWVTRFFDEFGDGEDPERVFHYKRPLYAMMGLPKPGR